MFLLHDRELLSLRNERKNPPTTTKENPIRELFSWLNKLSDQAQDLQAWPSWGSQLNLPQFISVFPLLWDTKLDMAALQMWHNKCWGNGQQWGLSAFWPCSILHGHAPFQAALGAVGQCCQNLLLAEVWPSRTSSLAPPLSCTLQLQELGPSRGQDLDFVLIECHMRILQRQPSWQPCPPEHVSPPCDSVCPGRERGIRTWLTKQDFESCCSWFLGLE